MVLSAVIAGAIALLVSVLTPVISSWRARRDAVAKCFDEAQASLFVVQSARQIATGVGDRRIYPGTDEEFAQFATRIAETQVLSYIDATGAARARLAAISAYVPEVRDWLQSGWELPEEQEPGQRAIIESRRAAAIRTERLFRKRRRAPGDGDSDRSLP